MKKVEDKGLSWLWSYPNPFVRALIFCKLIDDKKK